MNITFIDALAKHVALDFNDPPKGETQLRLQYDSAFPADSDINDVFLIVFHVVVNGRSRHADEDGYLLNIEFVARFNTDNPVDDGFKESSFVKVNAPAIAYPYLRAYVSNFLLLSGYDPVVLPTVNFTKLKPTAENERERL